MVDLRHQNNGKLRMPDKGKKPRKARQGPVAVGGPSSTPYLASDSSDSGGKKTERSESGDALKTGHRTISALHSDKSLLINDRFAYGLARAVGFEAVVNTTNNVTFGGLLHSFGKQGEVVLCDACVLDGLEGVGPDEKESWEFVCVAKCDIVSMSVKNVVKSGFVALDSSQSEEIQSVSSSTGLSETPDLSQASTDLVDEIVGESPGQAEEVVEKIEGAEEEAVVEKTTFSHQNASESVRAPPYRPQQLGNNQGNAFRSNNRPFREAPKRWTDSENSSFRHPNHAAAGGGSYYKHPESQIRPGYGNNFRRGGMQQNAGRRYQGPPDHFRLPPREVKDERCYGERRIPTPTPVSPPPDTLIGQETGRFFVPPAGEGASVVDLKSESTSSPTEEVKSPHGGKLEFGPSGGGAGADTPESPNPWTSGNVWHRRHQRTSGSDRFDRVPPEGSRILNRLGSQDFEKSAFVWEESENRRCVNSFRSAATRLNPEAPEFQPRAPPAAEPPQEPAAMPSEFNGPELNHPYHMDMNAHVQPPQVPQQHFYPQPPYFPMDHQVPPNLVPVSGMFMPLEIPPGHAHLQQIFPHAPPQFFHTMSPQSGDGPGIYVPLLPPLESYYASLLFHQMQAAHMAAMQGANHQQHQQQVLPASNEAFEQSSMGLTQSEPNTVSTGGKLMDEKEFPPLPQLVPQPPAEAGTGPETLPVTEPV